MAIALPAPTTNAGVALTQPTWANFLFIAGMAWLSGPTTARPSNPSIGQPFYDTTLNQMLFWNGSAWVQFAVIPNVQTGFINNVATSAGAGEDAKFVDVTITAVSAIANCKPDVQGIVMKAVAVLTGFSCRLTSTTNLRVSDLSASLTNITARWYVIDFGT